MKRLILTAFAAVFGIFAAGCGDVETDTGETLVISQAEEDIIGDIEVNVSEDAPEEENVTQVKITAKSLNVREQASADSARITTLNEGDSAVFLGEEGDWYQIRVEVDGEERTGYIAGNYAEVIEPEAGENSDGEEEALGEVEVTAKALKVRSEASTSGSVLTSLKSGEVVEYFGEEDGWYKVRVEVDGQKKTGYISADFAKVME